MFYFLGDAISRHNYLYAISYLSEAGVSSECKKTHFDVV